MWHRSCSCCRVVVKSRSWHFGIAGATFDCRVNELKKCLSFVILVWRYLQLLKVKIEDKWVVALLVFGESHIEPVLRARSPVTLSPFRRTFHKSNLIRHYLSRVWRNWYRVIWIAPWRYHRAVPFHRAFPFYRRCVILRDLHFSFDRRFPDLEVDTSDLLFSETRARSDWTFDTLLSVVTSDTCRVNLISYVPTLFSVIFFFFL